ncbi:MAG: 30S ribosomal protein S17e [Nanoarchaeota archaeon]|nr:30S ribosomal protein S17e [Nanoarchaeota archaeon]|tara:strand:- start:594 stop:782 length:189 start_codon:yes stop_codon:yes gene_type:complete
MGRIKTTLIKRSAQDFISKFPDLFEKDFVKNKEKLNGVSEIQSKKLRNKIAGYLTRLSKAKK